MNQEMLAQYLVASFLWQSDYSEDEPVTPFAHAAQRFYLSMPSHVGIFHSEKWRKPANLFSTTALAYIQLSDGYFFIGVTARVTELGFTIGLLTSPSNIEKQLYDTE